MLRVYVIFLENFQPLRMNVKLIADVTSAARISFLQRRSVCAHLLPDRQFDESFFKEKKTTRAAIRLILKLLISFS